MPRACLQATLERDAVQKTVKRICGSSERVQLEMSLDSNANNLQVRDAHKRCQPRTHSVRGILVMKRIGTRLHCHMHTSGQPCTLQTDNAVSIQSCQNPHIQ